MGKNKGLKGACIRMSFVDSLWRWGWVLIDASEQISAYLKKRKKIDGISIVSSQN